MIEVQLPDLSAVIERECLSDETPIWVSHCPELGVTSQGDSPDEAYAMLQEAVELLLEDADESEIERRLQEGGTVRRLDLVA